MPGRADPAVLFISWMEAAELARMISRALAR